MAKADVAAGKAYVSLYVRADALTRGLKKAQQQLQAFGASMQSIGRNLMGISAAALAPIAASTAIFAKFDDSMRMVKAVTGSTEAEFQMLRETAKKLGATTSFTAVEVAGLMTELGRAGFTANEIDAMTLSVMNLARATGTDASIAAGIMSATLRQFGLDATQGARVADVLTAAANSTFNTVEGLGDALSYAGPVAAELGMSLEDTVAILGQLGNVGIQGTNAGNALRRLAVISASTGEKLEEIFGVTNVDADGQMKPLTQILDEIGKSIEDLPVTEQTAKMSEAFGLLGITSASVLSGAGQTTDELAEKLRSAGGTAEKTAKEMDSGIGGAFRIIMSAAEGAMIAIGEAIAGPVTELAEFGTSFLTAVTTMVKANKESIIWFGKLAAAVGAAGAVLVSLGMLFSGVAVVAGGLASMITLAVGVFSSVVAVVVTVLSPLGLLVGLLVAGTYAWAKFTKSGQESMTFLSGLFTEGLSGIGKIFSDTFGGIVAAIRKGDLALAGQIAMVGLELAFLTGMENLTAMLNKYAGGWVEAFTAAARVISEEWTKAIDGITKYILDAASEGGLIGWALEEISGVNMQEEAARGQRLDAARRARGLSVDDRDMAAPAEVAKQTSRVAELQAELAALLNKANEQVEQIQSGAAEAAAEAAAERKAMRQEEAASTGLGAASAAASSLSELSQIASAASIESKQLAAIEKMLKVEELQAELTGELVTTVSGWSLHHA